VRFRSADIICYMRRLLCLLANLGQWVVFALWSLFWMSAAIGYGAIFRNDPNTPLSWARRFWGRGLVSIATCDLVKYPGFEPEVGKPYIFAMNHQSLFDIVAAFVAIPVNIRFIAKKTLRWIPFLGWYMSATGMVFIDRHNRRDALASLDEACQKIRGGSSILVYPEGTRSRDGLLLPFKKGAFILAIQAGVPIVPVAIEGCQSLLERDSLRIQGGRVHIIIGQPIPTVGLTVGDRDALMLRVRHAMIDLQLAIGGRGGDRDAVDANDAVAAVARVNEPPGGSASATDAPPVGLS
jgi:1-acyl-sn-glycerol-3-phosphate acyltransferase